MLERRILVRGIAGRYQKSQKKEKGRVLDEFVEMTGYQRNYASRLLRNQGRKVWLKRQFAVVGEVKVRSVRKRRKTYGVEVQRALVRLWKMLDYLCGKRLVAALRLALAEVEQQAENVVTSARIWETTFGEVPLDLIFDDQMSEAMAGLQERNKLMTPNNAHDHGGESAT